MKHCFHSFWSKNLICFLKINNTFVQQFKTKKVMKKLVILSAFVVFAFVGAKAQNAVTVSPASSKADMELAEGKDGEKPAKSEAKKECSKKCDKKKSCCSKDKKECSNKKKAETPASKTEN